MRAWIEDGVLIVDSENLTEHEYVRTRLVGQPLTTGSITLRGIGTAGGFRVEPPVQEVRTTEEAP